MRVTVYKDDHEEEILQSNCETMKKVIINEASTVVSTVINSKAPTEGIRLGVNKYRVARTDDERQSA